MGAALADIRDFSTTASSNTDLAPEGVQAGALNDAIRAVQAELAQTLEDMRGTLTTGGTTSAYTLTLSTTPASLADGLFFSATVNAANAVGPVTLVVTPSGGSAFASKKIRKISGGSERDLSAADMAASGHYLFQYDSAADSGTGAYLLLNPEPSGWRLLTAQTASASSTIDFTTNLDNTFDTFRIHFDAVKPGTDDSALWLRIGTGAGPTWATGASYDWGLAYFGTATTAHDGSAGDTKISLTRTDAGGKVGSASGEHVSGCIEFSNPEASDYFRLNSWVRYVNAGGNPNWGNGGGAIVAATAITGIRFLFSAGTISSGTFRLYGLAK